VAGRACAAFSCPPASGSTLTRTNPVRLELRHHARPTAKTRSCGLVESQDLVAAVIARPHPQGSAGNWDWTVRHGRSPTGGGIPLPQGGPLQRCSKTGRPAIVYGGNQPARTTTPSMRARACCADQKPQEKAWADRHRLPSWRPAKNDGIQCSSVFSLMSSLACR